MKHQRLISYISNNKLKSFIIAYSFLITIFVALSYTIPQFYGAFFSSYHIYIVFIAGFIIAIMFYVYKNRNTIIQEENLKPEIFTGPLSLVWFFGSLSFFIVSIVNYYYYTTVIGNLNLFVLYDYKENPLVIPFIVFHALVTAPVSEEIIFRFFLVGFFRRFLPKWIIVIISALVFWMNHIFLEPYVLFLAITLAILRLYSGYSIVQLVLLHSLYNLIMMIVGFIPFDFSILESSTVLILPMISIFLFLLSKKKIREKGFSSYKQLLLSYLNIP